MRTRKQKVSPCGALAQETLYHPASQSGAGCMQRASKGTRLFQGFQQLADRSAPVQRLLRLKGRNLPAASASSPVLQPTWFRMTSILTEQDEREVFEIRRFADAGDYLAAFERMVESMPRWKTEFAELIELCQIRQDVRKETKDILAESFETPGYAYGAGQVMKLLGRNSTIVRTMQDYQHWKQQRKEGEEKEMVDDPIDQLIEQFKLLTISVPFRSTADNYQEEHRVYHDEEDAIVASNPEPLKKVVENKEWEGQAITGTTLTQLGSLQQDAQNALYQIAGKSNKKTNTKINSNRSQKNMKALRAVLEDIAKLLSTLGTKKAPINVPKTDLSGSTNHGNNTLGTEGVKVVANPLSIRSDTPGSSPKDGRLMKAIRDSAGAERSKYKQMHLLNDLLFGPGQFWNLTPGPSKSNITMETQVEHYLKRAVLGKGLVVRFEANVHYNNDPNAATDQQITRNPDKYRFQKITFVAKQLTYDHVKSRWVVKHKQNADVATVDGATIPWNYGNLTPLTPKASIVDPKTSATDLENMGIPSAEAARIVAFIRSEDANGTPYEPPKAGKKDHLARKVQKFDGINGFDTTWNATKVYWTIQA